MEIETSKIKVNERVRKEFNDIEDLASSINELGQIQAITIDKDYNLIAGHRRLLACKNLGINIKAEIVNVKSELHKLDMELAENVKRNDFNPIELAEGFQRRKELYEGLHPETKAGQSQALGMNKKLGHDVKTESDPTFVEETAKAIGKSETFVKEHLQLNNLKKEDKEKVRDNKINKSQALSIMRKENKIAKLKEEVKEVKAEELNIFHGDCLEQLDKVENNSVACLIIDPPYGIDYQSNYKLAKHDKISNDKEKAFKLLDESLRKVKPKMKKDSHVYIFTSWKVYEQVKPIIEKYFEVKNCLIWNKNNWSMGDLNGNYAEKYEMIIFATQGNRRLLGEKRPVNVLDFERTGNSNHPTEKPVNLIKELIKNSTVEGEVVLDYFAGSGSTLVAGLETGRNPIGIESNEEYINIIKGRLK